MSTARQRRTTWAGYLAECEDLAAATRIVEEQAKAELAFCDEYDREHPEERGRSNDIRVNLQQFREQAKAARAIYANTYLAMMAEAKRKATEETVAALQAAGLEDFADAMETGEYASLEF
jgi:hypothetical protein